MRRRQFIAGAEVTRLGGCAGATQLGLHNDDGERIATAAAFDIVR